jgi:hypothetical protein
MSPIEPPQLEPIVYQGDIVIKWSSVGADVYYIFRDTDPIENVQGWFPYATIDHGQTCYHDSNLNPGEKLYYAVQAVIGSEKSALSNNQSIKLPEHLIVNTEFIQKAAYFESKSNQKYDEKVWTIARLLLIIERSFPNRDLDYLKFKVKDLKRDLPELKGILTYPSEWEIKTRAEQIYSTHPEPKDLDWSISEATLVLQKIHELIELESCVR